MSTEELLDAARLGSLSKVRRLIEEKDVNKNSTDDNVRLFSWYPFSILSILS